MRRGNVDRVYASCYAELMKNASEKLFWPPTYPQPFLEKRH